jgi:hypothetical protein
MVKNSISASKPEPCSTPKELGNFPHQEPSRLGVPSLSSGGPRKRASTAKVPARQPAGQTRSFRTARRSTNKRIRDFCAQGFSPSRRRRILPAYSRSRIICHFGPFDLARFRRAAYQERQHKVSEIQVPSGKAFQHTRQNSHALPTPATFLTCPGGNCKIAMCHGVASQCLACMSCPRAVTSKTSQSHGSAK